MIWFSSRQAWLLPNVVCFALTFRIDQKVSNSPYGYKLQEAQAILSEVRSIRDAISSGEKEKQELMQVTFILSTLPFFCPRFLFMKLNFTS